MAIPSIEEREEKENEETIERVSLSLFVRKSRNRAFAIFTP
jgi:hypothetical protein